MLLLPSKALAAIAKASALFGCKNPAKKRTNKEASIMMSRAPGAGRAKSGRNRREQKRRKNKFSTGAGGLMSAVVK